MERGSGGVNPFPTKIEVFRLYTIHIFISNFEKQILLLCLVVDIVFIFFPLKTINLHFQVSVSDIKNFIERKKY